MGEGQVFRFDPSLNCSINVVEGNDRLTSGAHLLVLREADHRLGIIEAMASQLFDPRKESLIRYRMVESLSDCGYGLTLGYSTQDHADRLAHGQAMNVAARD